MIDIWFLKNPLNTLGAMSNRHRDNRVQLTFQFYLHKTYFEPLYYNLHRLLKMEDKVEMEGFPNYLRLILLIGEGAQILRQLFRSKYKEKMNVDWEDSPAFAQQFISSMSQETYDSSFKSHQTKLLGSGNAEKWDIPLLASVIKSIDSHDRSLNFITSKLRRSIKNLVEFRNQHEHLPKQSLTKDQLQLYGN